MRKIRFGILFAGIALFAAGCGQPSNTSTAKAPASPANTNESTPAAPAATVDPTLLAKDLYAKNCMICHKDTGKGGELTLEGKTIKPDDLTSSKMKAKTDEQLTKYITDGLPDEDMPAFKDKLSADQIKAIVGHVRVLQGP
jgi:mono/diheme cytochrome c family protein